MAREIFRYKGSDLTLELLSETVSATDFPLCHSACDLFNGDFFV